MSEEKIPKTYHTPEESPIPVPPAEGAWSQMRTALDARLPVVKHWYTGHVFWGVATVATLTASVFLWVANRHKPTKHAAGTVRMAVPAEQTGTRAKTRSAGQTAMSPHTQAGQSVEDRETPAQMRSAELPGGVRPTGKGKDEAYGGHTHKGGDVTKQDSDAVGTSGGRPGRVNPGHVGTGGGGKSTRGAKKVDSRTTAPTLTGEAKDEKETLSWVEPTIIPVTASPDGRYPFFETIDSMLRTTTRAKGGKMGGGPKPGGTTSNKALIKKTDGFIVAGVSLAQGFPVGQQSFSSAGGNISLADYLPAPYLRLYREKWWVEAAFAFHSPQYTKPQLVDSTGGDTVITNGQFYTHYETQTVEKLYYTDIPITLHYHVTGGLWLGAGVQYSRLWGGVGRETQLYIPFQIGNADSVRDKGSAGFRQNTPGYDLLAKSSWRVLAEADYKWQRFTLAVRYGQALNSYLRVLPDGSPAHNKNNSLNLRLDVDLLRLKVRIRGLTN